MARVLSLLILLCYAPLALVQATPLRFCLIESRVLFLGGESCPYLEEASPKCCDDCRPPGEGQRGKDCCIDFDGLAEAAQPKGGEKLSSPLPSALLHPVTLWEMPPALPFLGISPQPPPDRAANPKAVPRAELNVWVI